MGHFALLEVRVRQVEKSQQLFLIATEILLLWQKKEAGLVDRSAYLLNRGNVISGQLRGGERNLISRLEGNVSKARHSSQLRDCKSATIIRELYLSKYISKTNKICLCIMKCTCSLNSLKLEILNQKSPSVTQILCDF